MKVQKRIKSRPVKPLLPDDVIMEILSRIAAVDVLKFRRVCRGWNSLILTQCFSDMHMKKHYSSFPMILVQEKISSFRLTNILLLLDRWEPQRKRTKVRKIILNSILPPTADLFNVRLHYNGLIVMSRALLLAI